MGGDLGGTWGMAPQIWGGGTAHVSVPPIFRDVHVVLSEACESTNWGKKVSPRNFIFIFSSEKEDFVVKKGRYTVSMTGQNRENTVDD